MKSNELSKKVYDKPTVKDISYYMIVGRNQLCQSENQLRVLKKLLKWRDFVARLDDESPDHMMPKHILFQIGRDLPRSRNDLRDSCRAHVPPAVQKYEESLLSLIQTTLQKQPKRKETTPPKKLKIDFTNEPMTLGT